MNTKLLTGIEALKKPPFSEMTTEDRLLRVLLMAYAKHHLDSPDIGWVELSDAMLCEICNTIGDDAFVEWGQRITKEEQ